MAEPNTQIEVARDAVGRRDWTAAYEGFHGVDPALLSAIDLVALADAAWWCSRFEESMAARQDAYTALVAAGDQRLAGAMAARLAIEFFLHEEPSVAMGFMGRAQRHMRDLPDCVEQGYLRMVESVVARETGRMEEALELARKAVAAGERFGDRDLLALSLHTEGVILLASGEVGPGLALMDEAMSAVLADQIDPYFAGIIYCSLIAACLDLSDIQRAGEWSDAATVWCASLPPGAPYIGMCRVNRAEVAQIRGSWAEAQAEAALATEELQGIDPWAVGSAHYQIGEIHRRRGDGAEAEAAYARAHALGREPQPGLALLRLGQGKQDAAVAAMRTALAGTSEWSRRSRLLPAQVEVSLAVGDGASARAAFEELHAMMGPAAPATMLAVVATAEGAVLLAEDDVHRATERLHAALQLWQRVKAPYETARARALYGRALAAGGDEEGALLERRAALDAFERLGARPDVEAMMAILGDPAALPGGLTEREAEVLRLVSAGKTNRDIAVELVISEHTVARHLQNMYAKLGVSSRAAATAFAFEHGLA